jgi:hypothetical protein
MADDDIYDSDDTYLIIQNYSDINIPATTYFYNTPDIYTYINNMIYRYEIYELTTAQCDRIMDYLSAFR